jgi:hypothetical protein
VNGAWPWAALAALGVFHGINPGMGWLFAVALGLHRNSRRVVVTSIVPIALGHAASVAIVLVLATAVGLIVDPVWLRRVAGLLLIGWGVWHWWRGSRHRVRVGMQTGMAGLALWSFLMATAHGAGLMLLPILLPMGGMPGHDHAMMGHGDHVMSAGSPGTALAALAVHSGAMLLTTLGMALLVYAWLGVAVLRRGWVNLDLLWTAALVVTGLILLVS